MPLQLRHDYAAGLHRGLLTDDINRPRSSRCRSTDTRCNPAHIRQVGAGGSLLRGVLPLVPHVHLSVLLAGPRPSDGAGPSRLCRGCLPPSPSSQGSGCLQLHQPAATGWRRRSPTSSRFTSASWRSMSQLHTTSGCRATSSGFTLAGWVAWRRRSRTSLLDRRMR